MANNNLPISLQTPSDIQAVTDYLKSITITTKSAQKNIANAELPVESQKWAIGFIKDNTPKAMAAGVADYNQLILSLPEVEIITAKPLATEMMTKIINWLRAEINPMIIVRPRVKRDIIGGLILRSGRHSYDLSVAEALDQSQAALVEVVHGWA